MCGDGGMSAIAKSVEETRVVKKNRMGKRQRDRKAVAMQKVQATQL
jgi:hypothetical protein